MEVEQAAAGGADLLMECDEEEQEVWPRPPEGDKGLEAAVSPMVDEEPDPPPVRTSAPLLPDQPESSCSATVDHTVKPPGPRGFMVNGQLVPLQPGGAGAELMLCSHPRGSASGFTSVQIPVTVPVLGPAGRHHIIITPELEASPSPIITGVVSGEAAQKVLSDYNVNFTPGLKTPPPLTLASPQTTPPSLQRTKLPSSRRPAAPHRLRHKGQRGPVSLPDCLSCSSQYKLITELRGFMCLCSPVIAQSLKEVRKKNKPRRWSREKKKKSQKMKSSSKVTRTPLPVRPRTPSDDELSDELSDRFTSPAHSAVFSGPRQDPAPPRGKLVILVEDFYYGSARGRSSAQPDPRGGKFTGPFRCIHCPRTLRNNLELMSHMEQHVSNTSKEDGDARSSCPHCFRHFLSPLKLQRHLETVHSQDESTVTCKICELEFGSEPLFLWHMKNTHRPGEMPYVCQVCDFRSSFYSDVWSHFQEAHTDTKHLLCQFCLRVLHSNTCYQQHLARHQKKHVFGCDKCRLHFLYVKERMEHKLLHHRTHVRPAQLTGLKPGTKVTVRTYSVVGGPDGKAVTPCKVVDVAPPLPPQEAPHRRPVESMGPLLSSLSEAAGVSRPLQRCVECLSVIRSFRTHFPSLVHCSLCRFLTCCATAYANHMINNHATCRKNPQYRSLFQSDPRSGDIQVQTPDDEDDDCKQEETKDETLSDRLECESCKLCTYRGDVMANHLTGRPGHDCRVLTDQSIQKTHTCHSVTSPGGRFVPIHLLPSRETSTPLSVKPLASPSPLSSPPAMTITFLGPHPQPELPPDSPLSVFQLAAVLTSLCYGLAQAARRCQTPAAAISSWIWQQERALRGRTWSWRTEKLAEWLLKQREQQLVVSEDVLLQEARGILGEDSQLTERYSWTVDFMLRHDATLQTGAGTRTLLPLDIKEKIHTFTQTLRSLIRSRALPPHRVGCMDEFSIFVRSDSTHHLTPSSFQLCGSLDDMPLFDVMLSALSDGTLLCPLLFFRGTSSHLPDGFPDNVLLRARPDGFTDNERLHIWMEQVWRPRVATSAWDGQSVLMVDVHRGHLTHHFLSSFTDVVVIPSGCSCRLQPLHVCVTPVLRDFLQVRWTQLVSQGLDGLGLDQLALTLACWLSELCSTVNSESDILRRSFSSVCDLQQVDDRWETERMIRVLNEALILPLEEPGPGPRLTPGPGQGPELELLLVMEKEKQEKMESREEVVQEAADLRSVTW